VGRRLRSLALLVVGMNSVAGHAKCPISKTVPAQSVLDLSNTRGFSVTYDAETLFAVAPGTPRCSAPVDYVTGLFRLGRSARVLVAQSSGSSTVLQVYDASKCQWAGDALNASAGFVVGSKGITVEPVCEKANATTNETVCSAAVYLKPSPDCASLIEAESESLKLTRARLGVPFRGTARILSVGTSRAKIKELITTPVT
jgi:hypothetical protein